MSEIQNFRKEIVDCIIPYARKYDRIALLVYGTGFGAIDKFQEEFPNRMYNMGIMEQGTVGIATGMAMSGLKPIVYSIVNFLAFRSLEQIRNDVILQDLNVKFISTGVNNYFKFLGKSHCCDEDDITIMDIIGMPVFDPYRNCHDLSRLIHGWITGSKAGHGHMRVQFDDFN